MWNWKDKAFIPDCEDGRDCPLADPNFRGHDDEVLVEAAASQCRCRNEEFLELFNRGGWYYAAARYLQDHKAGVAVNPEMLTPMNRRAVSLLRAKLDRAESDHVRAQTGEGKKEENEEQKGFGEE